jgi:hypothetical protein
MLLHDESDDRQCFICGTTQSLHNHHIFGGSNRKHSEKYKLKVDLCYKHHLGQDGVHFNKELMDRLHRYGQQKFERENPELSFAGIFGRNYL